MGFSLKLLNNSDKDNGVQDSKVFQTASSMERKMWVTLRLGRRAKVREYDVVKTNGKSLFQRLTKHLQPIGQSFESSSVSETETGKRRVKTREYKYFV